MLSIAPMLGQRPHLIFLLLFSVVEVATCQQFVCQRRYETWKEVLASSQILQTLYACGSLIHPAQVQARSLALRNLPPTRQNEPLLLFLTLAARDTAEARTSQPWYC